MAGDALTILCSFTNQASYDFSSILGYAEILLPILGYAEILLPRLPASIVFLNPGGRSSQIGCAPSAPVTGGRGSDEPLVSGERSS
jgi:hypothetical protein